MTSTTVVFTPAAETDLDDIWYAIALDNPAAADRTIDAIQKRCGQLCAFPESGPLRSEIAAQARSLNEGRYVILYRISATAVEIIRIVHGARDLTALF